MKRIFLSDVELLRTVFWIFSNNLRWNLFGKVKMIICYLLSSVFRKTFSERQRNLFIVSVHFVNILVQRRSLWRASDKALSNTLSSIIFFAKSPKLRDVIFLNHLGDKLLVTSYTMLNCRTRFIGIRRSDIRYSDMQVYVTNIKNLAN